MNNKKDQWIEEVFQSMKGSQRAKPNPELFEKIETQIVFSKGKVVPMYQWKYISVAVAATLIFLLNVAALLYYNQHNTVLFENPIASDTYNQSLITTYQIYE